MKKLLFVFAALILSAGMANGITDSLQFHYSTSFAADYNPDFWDPDISWRNKYKKDAQGDLVKPLVPRYFGSTTFLVAFTDAWHLFKMIHYALIRIALCVALVMIISAIYAPAEIWKRAAVFIGLYVGLWLIQAAGFHLFYTLL